MWYQMSINGDWNRRDVLKSTAGISIAGVAGCLGGGGDDGTADIEAGCSSTGSTSFQSCQAIQAVVDDQSDSINFITTAPGGDPASIRQHSIGEVDAYTAGNYIMNAAVNEEEPFNEDPVEDFGHLSLTYLTIYMYWVAVDGSGIESFDQAIEEDRNVWGFPPEWGLRRLLRSIMEEAGRWEDLEPNLVGISAEDVAGAIEEDRVEAFVAYGSNLVTLPGWAVEVDSRADVHAIETGDWFWSGQEASSAGSAEFEPFGWEQDIGTDNIQAWTEDFNIYVSPDVSADAVYELMDTSHNNWQEMRDALSAYPDHSNPEDMTIGYWDHPVHEGAAQFLRDNDAWDDSFTDGGEL